MVWPESYKGISQLRSSQHLTLLLYDTVDKLQKSTIRKYKQL